MPPSMSRLTRREAAVRALSHGSLRVGVAVGGTCTDLLAVDSAGTVSTHKVPSTPDDFGRAIADGLADLLAARAGPPPATPSRLPPGSGPSSLPPGSGLT